MNTKIYTCIIFLVSLFGETYSQGFKKNRVGYIANIGLATYTGELATNFKTLTFQPAMGVGVSYRIHSQFAIRAEVNAFKLSGENFSKYHSISFRSNNAELSAVLVYDFLPNKKSYKLRKDVVPYLFAGAGITVYKTSTKETGPNVDYRIINQNNTNAIPVLPFGLGFKIKASDFTDIIVEGGYRKTFTRNLDNIRPQFIAQTVPVNPAPEYPAQETKINNGKTDGYLFTSIKIVYSPNHLFKKKIKSATPQFRSVTKKNKETFRQISKNKKIANDKVIRFASNQ